MNIAAIRAALVAQKVTLAACNATIDSILAQLDSTETRDQGKRWMSLGEASKYTGKTRRILTTMVKNGQIESKMTESGGKMFVLV